MGSPECDWGRGLYSEQEHRVTLTRGFLIQQLEATQQEWRELGLNNPSGVTPDGAGDCLSPDCPVGNVSWYDAVEFANRRSQRDGLAACYRLAGCASSIRHELKCVVEGTFASIYDCPGYRLPTEAEWEYAARAGTDSSFYSGWITKFPNPSVSDCNTDPLLESVTWYCKNSNRSTHPGGGKPPNAWGLHDMLGNVFEWVSDGYDKRYPVEPVVNPGGAVEIKVQHTFRGGFFNAPASLCKASKRFPISPEQHSPGGGVRLVRTL